MSSPHWRLPSLPSALLAPGIDLAWRWGVAGNSLDHTPCVLLIGLVGQRKCLQLSSYAWGRGLWGEVFEIVFSCKILSHFFPFNPQTFWSSCCYNRGKGSFIFVIAEVNCMTQRKKTGICKSVAIAIRDVVKNGFHCIFIPLCHSMDFYLWHCQLSSKN